MSNYFESICVTVVTICRNAEPQIEVTMMSVLQQTYRNIEYVIVEGESTDETLQIVNKIASNFPLRTIKVISESDYGIADAMNKGVLNSSGDIIIHLHAGDSFIDKNVLDQVVQTYMKSPWRWAVAGSIVVNENRIATHVYRPLNDYKKLIKKNFIPHQSTFLVRDIFDKHGLFRVDMKQAMDYEYWLRIVFAGGERFTILPFNTTYFLSGGRSSKLFELLRYLIYTRNDLRTWGVKLSFFEDTIFLGRVIAFRCFAEVKNFLISALSHVN
ncbi:glycosyltransferase family 2 protein [Cylindrospermopsis curvispora]|uniref:Glycosyltransferase n=1 Tax=Cylindrospermopsis curvispora GIHE-G1 TaxID=2666332 RepID=A0A7H0F1X1_9CYAN|nr:glycosyltransferase family 2 protein [Cylindrospermopsis curvispora]QNP30037.1 glycosyltransferase [Cylindrospermopsis curvispora GIHE-G1]